MKLLLITSCLVLLTAFSTVNADVPKPKTPDKAAKQVLRTGLEIVPDSKAYEAKLQIGQSDLNVLRGSLDGNAGSAPVLGGIAFSAPRTIIAGLLMFMAVSVAGVLIARSSTFGRAQKTIGAALVSVHLFLEMLHYGVWIVALPLIGRLGSARFWEVRTVPIARHPKGFPRIVACALVFAVLAVVGPWFGFSVDYSATRDVYFTVAIAHVLAEAPFLLRML